MNSLKVQIRTATIDDLELVFFCLSQKAAFDGCPDDLAATPEQLKQTLFGVTPLANVLFAEVDGIVVGFTLFFYKYSSFLAKPCLWLDDLFVQPPWRGQGVGTALLQQLARIAANSDCGRIEWTVDANNGRGVAFYQKQGAQILDRIKLCRVNRSTIAQLANGS